MQKNPDLEGAIKSTLSQYGNSGFYTHAFFECGYLGQSKPLLTQAWRKDQRSIFDLASLTKALVTAPLTVWWAEKNQIPLKNTVGEWLGAFSVPSSLPSHIKALSIESLLKHQSGLPAWHNFYVNRLDPETSSRELKKTALTWIEEVFSRPDLKLLDKTDRYSDLGFILLGYGLEKTAQKPLVEIFADFTQETGIPEVRELGFFADFSNSETIPSAYCEVRRRLLCGEVHDENAASLGGYAGHAGLFGSGSAVTEFLKGLAATGFGQRFLQMNATETIHKDSSLFGWRQGNEDGFPFGNKNAIGHYGFTGTAFWLSPDDSFYVVLLSNRVISGRVSNKTKKFRFELLTLAEKIRKNL